MLAVSAGRLILLSSPFGRRGHFYETWENGGPDWMRVKITAHDVPRIDPDWLAAERAAIGIVWFEQEYLNASSATPLMLLPQRRHRRDGR